MYVKNLLTTLLLPFMVIIAKGSDDLPPLSVKGKHLVDDKGNPVTLHGVMDTPNRYFNGWRWQGWKP